MKERINVGLIRGRHEMPVSDYIFEEIENVLDFSAIESHINDFLRNRVGINTMTMGSCINQASWDEVAHFEGQKEVVCYVTGLTACTAALVACCARNGVELTLMHFNREIGEYEEQKLL